MGGMGTKFAGRKFASHYEGCEKKKENREEEHKTRQQKSHQFTHLRVENCLYVLFFVCLFCFVRFNHIAKVGLVSV